VEAAGVAGLAAADRGWPKGRASAAVEFRYIAIDGPMGAGKTTLARKLAHWMGADLLLEAPMDNPFLARFYDNPSAWALSTQLSFLLQRARQMGELRQADLFRSACVADFMLEKDRLFAVMNLDSDELDLYEQVYARVIDDAPSPDIVIYLQAPLPVLEQRIVERGVAFEQGLDPDYLRRLSEAYRAFFAQTSNLPFERVLAINTANADFVGREDHFARLVDCLPGLPRGFGYFDPSAPTQRF